MVEEVDRWVVKPGFGHYVRNGELLQLWYVVDTQNKRTSVLYWSKADAELAARILNEER